MLFSDTLKSHAKPLVKEIIQHPFLADIVAQDLAPKVIIDYVQQDEFYLEQYAKSLNQAFNMAPTHKIKTELEALLFNPDSESFAHTFLLAELGITNVTQIDVGMPNPTTQAYMDFLIANGSKDFYRLITALLPCAWVYGEFAKQLAPKTKSSHPLINWLQLYDNQFPDLLKMDLAEILFSILDKQNFTDIEKNQLLKVFIQGCSYEWRFFNASYFLKDNLIDGNKILTMGALTNA